MAKVELRVWLINLSLILRSSEAASRGRIQRALETP